VYWSYGIARSKYGFAASDHCDHESKVRFSPFGWSMSHRPVIVIIDGTPGPGHPHVPNAIETRLRVSFSGCNPFAADNLTTL
jgi:hypothetical protein